LEGGRLHDLALCLVDAVLDADYAAPVDLDGRAAVVALDVPGWGTVKEGLVLVVVVAHGVLVSAE
jgi:hypothetical protein